MAIKTVKIHSGYILREYAGEFCVFDGSCPDDGAVNDIPSFNPDGIYLWSLLESGVQDPEELNRRLADQNGNSPEDTLPDVQEFLARLINAHIVEVE